MKPLKNILAIALLSALVALGAMKPAYTTETKYPLTTLLRVTRDQPILEALYLMPGTRAEGALDIVVDKRTRIIFKDLREINRHAKDYDALSWISPRGDWVIYINEKHKNAPPEAIAAVIAHEAIHHDPHNSVREEVVAWHQEALVWMELRQTNPQLASLNAEEIPLLERLNQLAAEVEKGQLERFVRDNKGYRGLNETSPGFADIQARIQNPYGDFYLKAQNR